MNDEPLIGRLRALSTSDKLDRHEEADINAAIERIQALNEQARQLRREMAEEQREFQREAREIAAEARWQAQEETRGGHY